VIFANPTRAWKYAESVTKVGFLTLTRWPIAAAQHFTSELRADEGTGTSEWRNCYVSELLRGRSSTVSGRFVMDGIIYLVGLIVIVMFILSLLGLH
jgi:hypothetical protein